MTAFSLHPQLAADTVPVLDLGLCAVLLMDEVAWPWLVLVPRRPGLREFIDLDTAARHLLMDEITQAQQALQDLYRPDKLNVGALGNMVPQLHIHVIARSQGDPAWPGPVWGARPKERCTAAELAARVAAVTKVLSPRL
jgi:diadenosine tetraphosphate (Ap4A) HIT family hydrolase